MHRSFVKLLYIKHIPNKKKYYNNYDIVNLEKIRDFGNENLDKAKKFVMPSNIIDPSIPKEIMLDVWDTAGQEEYMALTRTFF